MVLRVCHDIDHLGRHCDCVGEYVILLGDIEDDQIRQPKGRIYVHGFIFLAVCLKDCSGEHAPRLGVDFCMY